MRRYIVSFISVALFAVALIAPIVHASATVDGTLRTQTTTPGVIAAQARQPSTVDSTDTQQLGYSYVAMGDSVAAGAGLPALANASTQDELCDRSSQAYPYIIAERLQTSITHTACSGAKVDEGIYDDQIRKGVRIPDQMSTAFTSGTPEIITATIGANDVRWTQFIRQCYVTRCGLAVDNARMKVYRADLRLELTRMLTQVKASSQGDPPKVYMSGYYSPFSSTGCITPERISTAEVEWVRQQTESLNQAIQSVTPLFNFVEYVPVDFTGHELCTNEPWVQGLEADAPIHPTGAGQAAIAESFLAAMGR